MRNALAWTSATCPRPTSPPSCGGEYNRPIRHRYEGVFAAKLRPQFPISETMGGKDWVLNIHYFRSFEEAETARLKFSELLEGAIKPQVARYTWRSVPLSHLSAYSFPGRLTRYAFTHELEAVTSLKKAGIVEHASSERQAKLNETEKKVLLALRKYPGMKRSEIARKVGIRQSSLSEVSKRLGQKEVIAATRMPDPRKLPGRDIAAFTWIDLAQPMPKEEYDECIMEMINSTPQLYSIYFSRTFILMISMFHSLDKAENSNVSTMERFGGNLKTLNFKIVPCEHLQMIHHPQFLEKLLGVSL